MFSMIYGTGKYTYELVEGWAKLPGGWSFLDVGGVTVDAQDRVYVFNRSAHPVIVFDHEGNFLTSWGEELFKHAHGTRVGPDGCIYCTDDKDHTVRKLTLEGELLMTLGARDRPSDTGYLQDWFDYHWSLSRITKGGAPFNRPTGVAIASSGEIYVTDGYGNARVHKFAADGKLLMSWGKPGGALGQFRVPHNIWLDKQDRLWVTDRENHRIQIFNTQGEFLSQWQDIMRPQDLIIDDEGVVYVADSGLRVCIFTPDGRLITSWGTEEREEDKALFLAPHAIAMDSRGDLYVVPEHYKNFPENNI
jgi:DNA-binding beta-propeller fold protein YncE